MLLFLLSIAEEEVKPNIVKLYNEHVSEMTKIAMNKLKAVGDSNYVLDAQDIIQNVFVRTVKYINHIPTTCDSDRKAYLCAMLNNEINRFVCAYNRIKNESYDLGDVPSDDNFIRELEIKERYNEVVDAIYRLDEKYSTVLLLRYVYDYTPAKMSQLLGISRPVVYKRLNKGKVLLLAELKVKGGEKR